jgi:hypothetical protein
MADEPTAAEVLAAALQKPQEVSVQGMGASREHPLRDRIAALKAMPRKGAGIKFSRGRNGGAV